MTSTFYKPVLDLEATGLQIKTLRKAAGISVRTLQALFNFPNPQAIYNWETGKNMPSIDNLLVLATIFNVNVEDIVRTRTVEVEVYEDFKKSA